MLKDKNIILGVTGGIAIYKSADLVSRLVKKGAKVEVIMTEAAREFMNPLTFQTMSNHPVHTDLFDEIDKYDVEHISLAKKADLVLVAPATANTIGKVANGIADNLLTTVIMATRAPVAFAPAMNTEMYNNIIQQRNMESLSNLGYLFIEPGVGRLACGDVGAGKMSEPIEIVEYLESFFTKKDLKDKKILITAGPTIEPLDPVRYITNHSTGRMGYSLAKRARDRGADVVLISGPTHLEKPKGIEVVDVNTTDDMFTAVGKYFDDADVLIKSAAPSDFKPNKTSDVKIKKDKSKDSNSMKVEFSENIDIVAHYGNRKKDQIVVGFAAETNDLEKYAKEKLKNKNLDFIVANDVTKEGAGFKTDTNIVTIIDDKENIKDYPIMDKELVADTILDNIVELIENKS